MPRLLLDRKFRAVSVSTEDSAVTGLWKTSARHQITTAVEDPKLPGKRRSSSSTLRRRWREGVHPEKPRVSTALARPLGVWPPQAWGGLPLSGAALRAPACGHLGRGGGGAGRGPAGRQRRSPPGGARAATPRAGRLAAGGGLDQAPRRWRVLRGRPRYRRYRRAPGRGRLRHRRQAHRLAVARLGRGRRDRLGRGDRHAARAGRRR
jgi:hypothetical protein